MTTIDPSELSAYIDGELDATRAAAVAAALAADEALAAELAALRCTDERWSCAARTAQFAPNVRLPRRTSWVDSKAALTGVVAALLALRFLPSLGAVAVWAFAIHGVALTGLVAWVVSLRGSVRDA